MANIEDRIKSQLERGKISLAKESLKEKYLKEDKADWVSEKQSEYDALYPKYREANTEEIYEQQEHYLNNASNEILLREDIDFSEFIYAQVEIDYSEDESYVTFTDWLNETRVVTEAIEEVSHTELIDGVETKVIDVEAVAEVTELVRPYTPLDVTDRVDAYIRQATTPSVVTMRQARLALLQSGLLATVEGAITNGTDEAMKIEWEYATDVRRDWVSLITLTEALGMTAEQLDELFILAGSK